MKKMLCTIVLTAGIATMAAAQVNLVYDFDPGPDSGSPAFITPYGSKLYMMATDGTHGSELWGYDGSSTPVMVQDLNPGPGSSGSIIPNQKMAVINNVLYFPGNNGATGSELYKYDGTSITLAADIEPGSNGSNPTSFSVLYNVLYMSAHTAATGTELWQYDPATSAASRIADIAPGAAGGLASGDLAVFNYKLYFAANDGTNGTELWSYNPAIGATSMVADIAAGSANSAPGAFSTLDGKLYFVAQTAAYGAELYVYNGSTAPTRLTDVAPGPLDGAVYSTVAYNGNILFAGSTDGYNLQLYKYSPATGTATLAATINPTTNGAVFLLNAYNGKVYFSADDGTHGQEVWMYNDTTATMVADLNPGNNAFPTDFQGWNGNMYIRATNVATGAELYRFSAGGTPSGIQAVSFAGTVKAYPNPAGADAQIAITLPQPQQLTIKVTDIMGQVIYTTGLTTFAASTTTVTVPLSTVAAGNYFYNLYNEQGSMQASGVIVKK